MSSYTKAKVWDQVYSTMVNLPSGIASTASALNAMNQNSINRDLEDRYEEYQAVVDYADSHSVNPAYDSREGFIQAASAATGVDRKFVKNVLDSVNWDPTRTNNSTLTDWMAQNGYGTESWRRDYVTKKLVESEENNIAEYIQTSLINDANEQLESNPSSLDNWSSFTGKKLNEYMNADKIANALNMNVQRVQELMTSGNISERINKWYETDFSDEMNKLQYQQQQAKLRQNVSANLKAMSLQAVTEGWDSKSYVNNVNKLIDSSGVNLITDSNERDRIAYDAFNEYVTQSTIEWS